MPLGIARAGFFGASFGGGGGGGSLPLYSIEVSSGTGILKDTTATLSSTTTVTTTCWIKSSSAPASEVNIIALTWTGTGFPPLPFGLEDGLKYRTDGTVHFRVNYGSPGVKDVYSTTAINDGTWHHVMAVWDANVSDTLKLYIDGVQEDSVAITHSTNMSLNRTVLLGDSSVTMSLKMYQTAVIQNVLTIGDLYNAGSPVAIDYPNAPYADAKWEAAAVGGDVTKDSIRTSSDWITAGTVTASIDIPV